MKKIIDTKEIISKEIDVDFNFYENDKYIGISIQKKSNIYNVVKILKHNSALLFNQLIDITAIDYTSRELRFDVIYLLMSLKLNLRILIKTSIGENDMIESISSIHKSANWYERECYDLFGIQFVNHPDLRRIMTDYNFDGHPLRKDFPLTGHNEVRYDDSEKKVVYDKVKLTQEFRNFDYSSPWEGFKDQFDADEETNDESKK